MAAVEILNAISKCLLDIYAYTVFFKVFMFYKSKYLTTRMRDVKGNPVVTSRYRQVIISIRILFLWNIFVSLMLLF
jgi:hypothetical protein